MLFPSAQSAKQKVNSSILKMTQKTLILLKLLKSLISKFTKFDATEMKRVMLHLF